MLILLKDNKEIGRFNTTADIQSWFSGHQLNYWNEITNRNSGYAIMNELVSITNQSESSE